jgi:hypothetical protein
LILEYFSPSFLPFYQEWEEKLTHSQEQAEQYKRKYAGLKGGAGLLDDARSMSQRLAPDDDIHSTNAAFSRSTSRRGVESVASLGSGLAQQARSLVGSFACSGINEHTGGVLASELAAERREDANRQRYEKNEWRDRRRSSSTPRSNDDTPRSNDGRSEHNDYTPSHSGHGKNNNSRSFRDYSNTPRRVDV